MGRPNLARAILDASAALCAANVTDGLSGNLSARDHDRATFLITPSGRPYRSLGACDLVTVDLQTGRAGGLWKPSSEWRLHGEIYRVRPDVNAVVHHHGIWSSAVAVARKTIPFLIDEAVDLGPIHTAAYAPSASGELAEVVAHEMARGDGAILLANHGAVAVGRTMAESLRRSLQVERLAQIYLLATLLGGGHELDGRESQSLRVFFQDYRDGAAGLEPASAEASIRTGLRGVARLGRTAGLEAIRRGLTARGPVGALLTALVRKVRR